MSLMDDFKPQLDQEVNSLEQEGRDYVEAKGRTELQDVENRLPSEAERLEQEAKDRL